MNGKDERKDKSHPVRGAWIEIQKQEWTQRKTRRRTPSGVRGLKYSYCNKSQGIYGRTPSGD